MRQINQFALAFRRYWSVVLALLLILSMAGCSIKLIADYDEVTDEAVTKLQRKVDGFLIEMQRKAGTPEAAYEKHVKFYDEVRLDLDAIRVRAAARPNNDLTIKHIALIQENVDTLEKYHKLGFQDPQELAPLRSAFDISFTAILKLELAKKRGE